MLNKKIYNSINTILYNKKILLCSFVFVISIFLFFNFSYTVKKDLIWYNNSDQNGWVIYSSLEFNDGNSSLYISHPGVTTSFLYGFGFRLFKNIGSNSICKTSDFEGKEDPIHLLPALYEKGGYISVFLILSCALIIAYILNLITKNIIIGLYGAIFTLFSGGFLFQSVVVRNELSASFYSILSLLFFSLVFYREKRLSSITRLLLLICSGFFFGFAYFAKAQIILPTVFFFLFCFFLHYQQGIYYETSNRLKGIILLFNCIISAFFLFNFSIEIPFFWKTIIGVVLILNGISFGGSFYKNHFFSFVNIISQYSLGFLLSIIYVLKRGLKGIDKNMQQVLDFTSLYKPNKSSAQLNTIDPESLRITHRFYYYLDHYFLENFLLLASVSVIYFLVKKYKEAKSILIAIILVVALCYLNAMRANMGLNIDRATFKYMIFIDLYALGILVSCYYLFLKDIKRKAIVHICFWAILLVTGFNNYHKAKDKIFWDWTTFPDIVYPERWLFPGSHPELKKIFNNYYKGHYNGHDRVIFGDEISRDRDIKLHLNRSHKYSMEPFMGRLLNAIPAIKKSEEEVKTIEKRIFKLKIRLFEEGKSYKEISDQVIKKRKFLYQKTLDRPSYTRFQELLDAGRLTVPF